MRPDGSIPIEFIAAFNRVQKLTNDYNVILQVKNCFLFGFININLR